MARALQSWGAALPRPPNGARMTLSRTTPILRILDEAQARAFYVDFLGFEVVFEHRFEPHMPLYMGLIRDDCSLHLSGHAGDAVPGGAMRIQSSDVDALCAELNAKGPHGHPATVQAMPWGTRDLTVEDPFGNRLTFTTAIST